MADNKHDGTYSQDGYPNKHGNVFTGPTQARTDPNATGIQAATTSPYVGRDVAPIGSMGGQGLGAGWSSVPKVPGPRSPIPLDQDVNRALPEGGVKSTAPSSPTTSAGYSDRLARSQTVSSGRNVPPAPGGNKSTLSADLGPMGRGPRPVRK